MPGKRLSVSAERQRRVGVPRLGRRDAAARRVEQGHQIVPTTEGRIPVMNVPLLDLKAQYRSIKADVDAAVAEMMESQHFIPGAKGEQCEKAIARYCGCSHAGGGASGTHALLARPMGGKNGPRGEIITNP